MTTPRYQHHMPFGAAPAAAGGFSFSLWAPAIDSVRLQLNGGDGLAMRKTDDGWHRLDVAAAVAGDRYAFILPDGLVVPDPASRSNPDGVHAASALVDPNAHAWPASEQQWRGRPWREAVIYELHVGAFSAAGDFAGVAARLDELAELGVTVIELMPLAAFPGQRNWGYDGVLAFAPAACYGAAHELKSLVAAAHARGLQVILDVVYNHFGPDGNYLYCYCPQFFDHSRQTPWGAAIHFDGGRREVRDFFIHNALFWLAEYRLDGLRLDAIHAIDDASPTHIVDEIRAAIAAGPGAERCIHLLLENDDNRASLLRAPPAASEPGVAVAQWNDDYHHAMHVILSGENDGYYADFAAAAPALLARCLTSGFAWQGEASPFRDMRARGEASGELPPTCFVNFLQNHDQIGNRALGERLHQLAAPPRLHAAAALLLLAPQIPLLFMGEEYAAAQPFLYFCDFGPDLADAVREGRRNEFAAFARFADPAQRSRIPDPQGAAAFNDSKLQPPTQPQQLQLLALHRQLLRVRREEIAPRLDGAGGGELLRCAGAAFAVSWRLGDGALLMLTANLDDAPAPWPQGDGDGDGEDGARLLFAGAAAPAAAGQLPPWSVSWRLREAV